MPTQRAFPYPYLEHELLLEVYGLELDGEEHDAYINSEQQYVQAQELDWTEGGLHLRVVLPEKAPAALLPDFERNVPNWHVLAVASCRSSRWRRGFPLQVTDDPLVWEGVVPLKRRLLHGGVKLTAYLVRTTPLHEDAQGFGANKNVRLASSHEWTFQVDEPQTPPGGFLDTRWEDFSVSPHVSLQRNKDLVFYLETGPPYPVLYLNSSHASLEGVLESSATVGLPAAVRDVISSAIAQNVWMTLATTALLSGYDRDGERREVEGWQANVLGRFERQLHQEADIDIDALIRDPESAPVLMEALSASVQRMSGASKSTFKILKEADKT